MNKALLYKCSCSFDHLNDASIKISYCKYEAQSGINCVVILLKYILNIVRFCSILVVAVGHLEQSCAAPLRPIQWQCVWLDTRKMWAYFFISLSMRPAYNNPFNQAPNPFARRQHAMNKAVPLLIFMLGTMGVKSFSIYCSSKIIHTIHTFSLP